MDKRNFVRLVLLVVFCFLLVSTNAKAAILGESKNFFLDSSYDQKSRKEISAQLVLETDNLYFYIDNSLWQLYSLQEKSDTISNLSALSGEFKKNIYPILTSNYGFEWNPGIDNDPKITILFHQLKRGAGGYFNAGNEYSKFELPVSNEREMVYLNSDYIASPLLKRLLAHEFTHLITFNQKDRIWKAEEDVWLNEARAEYGVTLSGYDDIYSGSNLQKRVIEFLKNPNDSLIEWSGNISDYGVLNVFIQYLTDQYGVKILNDSLHSSFGGMESLNYALLKNGYSENFSDIFTNWTIAILLNDCSHGSKYCYKNKNLANIKVLPESKEIAFDSPGVISINYVAGDWSGYWNSFYGSAKNINFEFHGDFKGNFKIPYLLCGISGKCVLNFLNLDNQKNGSVKFDDFGENYASVIFMPSIQNSKEDIGGNFPFFWNIESNNIGTVEGKEIILSQELIGRILAQIEEIKGKIIEIQKQIDIFKRQQLSR